MSFFSSLWLRAVISCEKKIYVFIYLFIYLLFCEVVKMFNKSTRWLWFSWLGNSILLLNPDPQYLHPSYCHFPVPFGQIKCCGKSVQFLWRSGGYYSVVKLAFCLALSHLPLSLCGTKGLTEEESKESIESKRGTDSIRVFSVLFTAAFVSLLLWKETTYQEVAPVTQLF